MSHPYSMETRVRSTTNPGFVWPFSWVRFRAAPDAYGDPFGPHYSAYSEQSEYYEEMTPNSSKYGTKVSGSSEWKSFEHYRIKRQPRSTALRCFLTAYYDHGSMWRTQFEPEIIGLQGYTNNSCFYSAPTSMFGEPGFPIRDLPLFYQKRPTDNGFVPPPENLEDLERRALSTMMPGIKAGLSSINTLIELKDFKSLPKTVSHLGEFVDNLSKIPYVNIATSIYRQSKITLRQLFRGTASGYLEAKFNVLSFLSDLSALQKVLVTHQHQISELIARLGQVQVRHFSVDLNEFPLTFTDQSDIVRFVPPCGSASSIATTVVGRRSVSSNPSRFHVEISYNYMLNDFQVANAQLLGLLDSLGVNFNPRIIWNAIPFSFIVDWVVNVGRFLENFSHRNLEPKVNILHYCWSIKRDRSVFVDKTLVDNDNTQPEFGDIQVVPCRTVRETAYRRQTGWPTPSLLSTSGLSATEVSLGAALLITRKWKPKRRS